MRLLSHTHQMNGVFVCKMSLSIVKHWRCDGRQAGWIWKRLTIKLCESLSVEFRDKLDFLPSQRSSSPGTAAGRQRGGIRTGGTDPWQTRSDKRLLWREDGLQDMRPGHEQGARMFKPSSLCMRLNTADVLQLCAGQQTRPGQFRSEL